MKKLPTLLITSALSTSSLTLALDNKLEAHGFVSVGASQLSEDVDGLYYKGGQTSDVSPFGNTWFGFQINAELTSSTEFVYQVIVEADDTKNDNFDTRSEWMYIKQELGAGFNAQLGRIRLPAFLDSEVLYVAQTYPWVNAPAEIYNQLPVNHIDGVSINQRSDIGDWTLDTKAIIWGQSKGDGAADYGIALEDTYGIAFDASLDALRIHFAFLQTTESGNINVSPESYSNIPNGMKAEFKDDMSYFVLGTRFDDGNLYASAEGVLINADEGVLAETEAMNVTFGWYFGDFLPYLSFSKIKTPNADDLAQNINEAFPDPSSPLAIAGLPYEVVIVDNGSGPQPAPIGNISAPFLIEEQESLSLGVKYNLTPKVAIKAQAQYIDHFKGSTGLFTYAGQLPFDDVYLYDLAIQAVF
jgi:hypothetical protein